MVQTSGGERLICLQQIINPGAEPTSGAELVNYPDMIHSLLSFISGPFLQPASQGKEQIRCFAHRHGLQKKKKKKSLNNACR